MLEDRGQPYVLAVRSNQHLRFLTQEGLVQTDPAYLAGELDAGDWQALSAGEGAKGPRLYHWARLPLNWTTQHGFERWLLFRCSLKNPDEIAYYFVHAREGLRSRNWPEQQACPGPSRNASCAPRMILVSIIARPAPGMAGIAT